jgi:hypothetical protein
MRPTSRACVAIVAAISMSTGGAWPLVAGAQAASGPKALVSRVGGGASVHVVEAFGQSETKKVQNERAKLAERFAATERLVAEGKIRYTDIGRRAGARLKRVLAILEIPDLSSSSERAMRFQQLGISRSYRGADLIVKVRDSERTVKGLGAPVHLSQVLKRRDVPDGASASGREEFEWEQDWEDAQIEAEDTIVSIEALEAEGNGWITDLEAYEGAPAGCAASGPSDADSGRNCFSAVANAIAEAIGAVVAYAANSAAVNAAITAARNSVTNAMALFTGGMLTLTALAEAAVGAITALCGSSALGWLAAAGIAILTAGIVYEVIVECFHEAMPLEQARGYMR